METFIRIILSCMAVLATVCLLCVAVFISKTTYSYLFRPDIAICIPNSD